MSTNPGAQKGRGSRGVGDITQALARKIKGLRAENGLSQEELSARAGIPYPTYRKLEKGTTVIDVEQQTRIAIALGIDPDDLYDLAVAQARLDAERDTVGDDSDEARFRRLMWVPIGEIAPQDREFVLKMLDRRKDDYALAASDARAQESGGDGEDVATEEAN